MNTLKFCFIVVFMFVSSLEISAQSDSLIDIFTAPEDLMPGEMPKDAQNIHGGKLKTAQGVLKVLCVFVRFNGDNEVTVNWPNPAVLPSWAENIVDAEIPQNQIYSHLNVSNFFDRSSGGDGSGNLGAFQMIGDVVYITTYFPRNSYINLTSVNEEIFSRLDETIDYSEYDNWTFVKDGEYFNHDLHPDGILDQVFIFHRQLDIGGSYGGFLGLGDLYLPTNDYVLITGSSGTTHFNYKNKNFPDAAYGPGHEYGHYLFGGGQTTGHIDGRDYDAYHNWTLNNSLNGWTNYGRVNPFTLMCTGSTGYMSAYEKYRLGWLNPTIIETNTSYINLEDTHVKSKAILIPLEYYAGSSNLKQYYLIENFHSLYDYAGANPFVIAEKFGHIFSHGLLIFQVNNESYEWPTTSDVRIVSGEGNWHYTLSAGGNTPANQYDDTLDMLAPGYNTGFNELEFITLTVGSYTYTNYCRLDQWNSGPYWAGARYISDDFLGTRKTLFRENENDIFSLYSNPAASLRDGTYKNVGIQILGYNSTTKNYSLSIQLTNSAIVALKPSKPQHLRVTKSSQNHPLLTWVSNKEPDITGYSVYKKSFQTGGWVLLTTTTSTQYEDLSETYPNQVGMNHTVEYRITANDNQPLESVPSDIVQALVQGAYLDKAGNQNQTGNSITEYRLYSSYPNPFNPVTIIEFALPEQSDISLKVYDILGKEIATLATGSYSAGRYTVPFDGTSHASGVYIYKLSYGKRQTITKKMTLLK